MFNFFRKKSTSCYSETQMSEYEVSKNFSTANRLFIDYYYQVAPLGSIVDMIANAIASLPISAVDKKGEFNYDAEILNRLNKINADQSFSDFIEEVACYYILTGNVFIDFNKIGSSFEMIILKPQNITASGFNINGKASQIMYSATDSTDSKFYRAYNYNYETKQYQTQQGNILLHLKNKNLLTTDTQFGVSFIAKAQWEIAQYYLATKHNANLIHNGCRPSLGFFVEAEYLDDRQVQGLKDTMKAISGEKNSGKPFLFAGGKTRVEKFSESMKDMDFQNLKSTTSSKIAQCLEVPLPLVSEDNMTYSNFESSQVFFYEKCVLQFAKKIIDFLNNNVLFLLNENNYKLKVDETAINALELKKVKIATEYSKTASLTTNEIRTLIGYESIENGDTVYQPQNLIPIGADKYTQDNRDTPSDKSFFIASMKEQGYNDDEIKSLIKQFFGE